MKIYSAIIVLEDNEESISAMSLPASSEDIASEMIEEAIDRYGNKMISYGISVLHIDQGFGPEPIIQ